MKKLIVFTILVLSAQAAFTAPGRAPVREITIEQARTRVQQNSIYRELEAARVQGRDIMTDPVLREKMSRAITATTRNIKALSGPQMTNMMKLANINPLEVMAELTRLSTISQDANASAAKKAAASKALDLMAASGHLVRSVAVNSAQARAQNAIVLRIIEVSKKISSLNFGSASTNFIARYERALREGKTIDQAIRVASNNKFGERELRDCQ